ncbi:MAG: PQQ-binding-like beta-propeller repeat protein [Candidatus Binatia bacterium]|nr:PQQ-binding-like beta-propeller repeat protein [Candidatus Binatia bacterium]
MIQFGCGALIVVFVGCGSDSEAPGGSTSGAQLADGWPMYGRNVERTFYNDAEARITRSNVASMRLKWRYQTGAIVTASPTVAWVHVPGEGRIKVVYVPSWDGFLYALRVSNGSRLWSFAMKPHPGASYPQASSPTVAHVAGEERVYVGGGMTMYCLAAATGELRWSFDAGTGCTTCGPRVERNQVESSPAVVENLVVFGMDVNDRAPGKGGVFAVDATEGHLVWYFDVDTGQTCRPFASDRVRKFDGYHSAEELGLPPDFFTTRPGCNFNRRWTACGNVWSSFAVDTARRLLFTASSNCDTDNDPDTVEPAPPMPPFEEAIFALSFDGAPVWRWRPREVDNADLAFGAVPNLFTIRFGGSQRDVLGVGNKDGTYYVLDREGVNKLTGRIEPYWAQQVVPGGAIGGIIGSAAVGGGAIFFSTAIGESFNRPQRPAAWSLTASDGSVRWADRSAAPSYAATTATREVVFMGSLFSGVYARDADTGEVLKQFSPLVPVASAVTVLDGEIFFGAGIGDRGGNPEGDAYRSSLTPSVVSAYCLPDSPDCPSSLCDDGDACTYDYRSGDQCVSERAPDGLFCPDPTVGPGRCVDGRCVRPPA